MLEQKDRSVQRLFFECWSADPRGLEWKPLSTKLKRSAFRGAKRKLSDQGLFVFKPEKSMQDGCSTTCWMVRNLHGSSIEEYWGVDEQTLLTSPPSSEPPD